MPAQQTGSTNSGHRVAAGHDARNHQPSTGGPTRTIRRYSWHASRLSHPTQSLPPILSDQALGPSRKGTPRRKLFIWNGTRLVWTHHEDFLDNQPARRDNETDEVFASFQGFEEAITKVFGTTDEEREAEQKLRELRQRISASDYAAKFRQVTSKLDWDDEPLMSRFYDGLKEEVKDELYKENRPDNLSDYIAMAVRIDDRQYARRQERNKEEETGTLPMGTTLTDAPTTRRSAKLPLLTPTQLTQAKWTWMQQRRAKENASTAGKLDISHEIASNLARRRKFTGPQPQKLDCMLRRQMHGTPKRQNGTGWFQSHQRKPLQWCNEEIPQHRNKSNSQNQNTPILKESHKTGSGRTANDSRKTCEIRIDNNDGQSINNITKKIRTQPLCSRNSDNNPKRNNEVSTTQALKNKTRYKKQKTRMNSHHHPHY
ncbi:retrotransposon gag protein [Hirsutella rhossiliensis]|uniref:Retrotransposon gag protein n=1 Tax=Hirsutella rhossiliensis TaxID=111463 RepID=A0A9P8N5T3_9HYPO|nr:retrotransposon gag protein [Hirsutella rhossiliensis]KAH0967375.1 retrotransposon gag protein [Hirsutella rhossiliensis]